jgi:hypothetical protein
MEIDMSAELEKLNVEHEKREARRYKLIVLAENGGGQEAENDAWAFHQRD